ncbi:tyrosine-protein phosphatase [Arthrobacter sp. FW306-2-2C-D06B]|uniref:tyrosine-protein phosphatase n=1 Tax=Arthrobacter sp. FW306-2-2C-D06B TaxID=2879618 RepID=UPI001F377D83|nr:tyrosine-protein phosphatase [Arthrobacter sp. FW306-2-2C-D06B]UKA59097.1 tyrosine-protein phosphatase [Arthrobacter sp. FW306-2-2C-D06B]
MAVLNLRSLAGGRILRGSQPFGMDTAATAAFLERHGIQAVVDLRSEYERAIVPWQLANGAVELVENPLDPRTASDGLQSIHTAEDLGELYLGWVRARPDWVAESLRPAAQGKRTLIHCSLGKDRTGVVSALALLATGADHAAVVADYAASTAALPTMLETMAAAWRLAVPEVPEEAFSPSLMLLQSPDAAMEYFLDRFGHEFGSAADYLRDAGLSGSELDRLRLS